jgi:putative membrane protein
LQRRPAARHHLRAQGAGPKPRPSHSEVVVRGFIVGTVATAIAFWIVASVFPEYLGLDFLTYEGEPYGLLILALIFGVINGLIGPIVRLIALPISFMTLGLFGFVINGILLIVVAWIAQNLEITFTVGNYPPTFDADTIVAAIVGAVVLGVVNSLAHSIVKD